MLLRLAWGEGLRSWRSVLIKLGHEDLDCRVSVRDLSKKDLRILVIQGKFNAEEGMSL